MSSWQKKGIKGLTWILLIFIVQEISLRILFPLPEVRNLDRIEYLNLNKGGPYTRDQTRTWQSAPDTAALFYHEMNRYGFRDQEWYIQKDKNKKRILFVGDSFVEGIMAPQDQTIPTSFQAAAGPDQVEVLNGGILGKGLEEYLQLTADLLPLYQPDYLIISIYANDLGKKAPRVPDYYLEPEYFPTLEPRFITLLKEASRHGPVLPIWGKSPKTYLPKVPKPNNPWTNHADKLSQQTSPKFAKYMQEGTFNPFRSNSLYKEEKYLKQAPLLGEFLPFIHYICKENGTRPLIVYLPSRHQTTKYYLPFEREICQQDCSEDWDLTQAQYQVHAQTLAQACQQHHIPFADMTPQIKAQEERGNHLYWRYDEHMRGKGYRWLGKKIYEIWDAQYPASSRR